MTPHENSRFKKVDLTDRQLKSFDKMYVDREYSLHDICERFGLGQNAVIELARKRNLSLRAHNSKK